MEDWRPLWSSQGNITVYQKDESGRTLSSAETRVFTAAAALNIAGAFAIALIIVQFVVYVAMPWLQYQTRVRSIEDAMTQRFICL